MCLYLGGAGGEGYGLGGGEAACMFYKGNEESTTKVFECFLPAITKIEHT